jgi:FixJ family two-component response regulator
MVPGRRHILAVLSVDSDDDAVAQVGALLVRAGYDLTLATSAFGTVGLARRLLPDVILLDLALPLRSGAALLSDLQAEAATAAIPVVVLSAVGDILPPAHQPLTCAVLPRTADGRALLDAVRRACDEGARRGDPPSSGTAG